MELIDALEQTFEHAHEVIGNVRADQYDDPTPCPDWTVRDLLSHTIGVVAGLGAAASGTAPTEFALGTDPAAQFRAHPRPSTNHQVGRREDRRGRENACGSKTVAASTRPPHVELSQ